MTFASDEKWRPFNCFFQSGRAKDLSAPLYEEIKGVLKSGNACCHSVKNILSSNLLSKILKTKIVRIIILPVFCVGVKLGLSH